MPSPHAPLRALSPVPRVGASLLLLLCLLAAPALAQVPAAAKPAAAGIGGEEWSHTIERGDTLIAWYALPPLVLRSTILWRDSGISPDPPPLQQPLPWRHRHRRHRQSSNRD